MQGPLLPDEVNSGDLITADFINNLLFYVQGLENRVRILELAGTGTPPVIPHGNITITMTGSPATETLPIESLDPGRPYDFVFTVEGQIDIDEYFTVETLLTVIPDSTDWEIRAVNEDDSPLSRLRIPHEPPPAWATRMVKVRVTIPEGTEGHEVELGLRVTSERNPVGLQATTDPPYSWTVGGSAPEVENFTFTVNEPAGGSYFAGSNTFVPEVFDRNLTIPFSANLPVAGEYVVTILESPGTGWELSMPSTLTQTDPGVGVLSATLTVVSSEDRIPSTKLTFRVTTTDSDGQEYSGTGSLNLEL